MDCFGADLRASYDMTGTTQLIIQMRSGDGGRSWEHVGSEPFHTPMNGVNCQAEVALSDGTIVRGVIGTYQPFYDVPQTGYTQWSVDGGRTWDEPTVVMGTDEIVMCPKRLRLLRDGRLAMTGGFWTKGSDTLAAGEGRPIRAALWLSTDRGRRWSDPIPVAPSEADTSQTEKTDFAELADGRLLFVTRCESQEAPRRQSVLVPDGEAYRHESTTPAPFPRGGHPEMLAAREGVALYVATSGISWTADTGETWADLDIGGTEYYPRSVQLGDERIFCVGHRGSDDPYDGSVDQEILGMTFGLNVSD
ncbi:MAG: hypothetical protein CMJ49_05595 [Planctomycetaceae bacterium]|nr:hypothetical protein [Planctomycetaceae bacterium]